MMKYDVVFSRSSENGTKVPDCMIDGDQLPKETNVLKKQSI